MLLNRVVCICRPVSISRVWQLSTCCQPMVEKTLLPRNLHSMSSHTARKWAQCTYFITAFGRRDLFHCWCACKHNAVIVDFIVLPGLIARNARDAHSCCLFSSNLGKHFVIRKQNEKGANNVDFTPSTANYRFRRTRQIIIKTQKKVMAKVEEIMMRENILTVPNCLSITRIILSPVIGYLVMRRNFEVALGIFVVAGITDMLDGYIARNFKNQQSMFGSFIDPLADKLLVACLMLSLTLQDLIPIPLTMLIITRDVILITAALYVRYVSLPVPRTLSRYIDVTLATAQLSPTLVSRVNTVVQLVMVAVTLMSPIFDFTMSPYMQILFYITAASTVTSGLSYVKSKNTYKLINNIKKKSEK